MQLIKTEQHSAGSVIFSLPGGRYAGLYVRLAGTNQAGQTLAATELGTLRLNHFNNDIVNIAPDHLINLTNLYGGTPENASAAGAAYTFSFLVPFRKKFDRNNSLNVVQDQTKFVLSGFNTAKVASGTIEVYAIFTDAPSLYIPVIKGLDIPISAAVTGALQKLPEANISQFYVVSDAALTRAQFTVDGKVLIDGAFAAIDAYSDATNIVETGITFVEIFAPKSDSLSESVNSEVNFRYTTSGAINPLRTCYFALVLPQSR